MKPFINLTPEDVRALAEARKLPPPPIEARLKMDRQLGLLKPTFEDFFAALEKRHLAELTFAEVRKGVQALSSLYVERREKLTSGAALDGAGKRAAFALYYGPLHLLSVREIAKALGAVTIEPPRLVDLGCGTLGSAAGWALAVREAGRGVELVGVEKNGWAAGEARFTLSALGLRGKVVRADVLKFELSARDGAILAAYTANELDDAGRALLLARLLEAAARGARVLVVEPLAKRHLGWWSEWEKAFAGRGGRADEWRFTVELPEKLRLLDKAAGLDHRQLGARSLYVAGAP